MSDFGEDHEVTFSNNHDADSRPGMLTRGRARRLLENRTTYPAGWDFGSPVIDESSSYAFDDSRRDLIEMSVMSNTCDITIKQEH